MKIFELNSLRSQFPALSQTVNGNPLVYLDSAATTLKPRCVVDRVSQFYLMESSNVHRGAHFLSDQATGEFEAARQAVADFLCAHSPNEVVFTRGTTDGINLLARTLGEKLEPGDEILLSKMEHHSNIVPWQLIAEEKSLRVRFVDLTPEGELCLESFNQLLNDKTKILSLVHCSNSLGTINPISQLFAQAKARGVTTVLDAAQAVSFLSVDVTELGCDFLVFSGHKLFAPTGVGVLWGKEALLNELRPYQGGGSMIDRVTIEKTTFLDSPHRFEAGTPHIAGVIGLGKALEFLKSQDLSLVQQHERALVEAARQELCDLPKIRFIGTAKCRANILSFVFEGLHPSDIGQILDKEGVAVRTGHHCTQPLMDFFGIPGTIRASFSIYNSFADVQRFSEATKKALGFFI